MKVDEFYCKKFNLNLFVLETYVNDISPSGVWKIGTDQTTSNPNEFLHHTLLGSIESWAKHKKIELKPYDAPKPKNTDGRFISPESRVNNLRVFIDEAEKLSHESAKKLIKKFENDFGKMRKGQKREFYLSFVRNFTKVYCS